MGDMVDIVVVGEDVHGQTNATHSDHPRRQSGKEKGAHEDSEGHFGSAHTEKGSCFAHRVDDAAKRVLERLELRSAEI